MTSTQRILIAFSSFFVNFKALSIIFLMLSFATLGFAHHPSLIDESYPMVKTCSLQDQIINHCAQMVVE